MVGAHAEVEENDEPVHLLLHHGSHHHHGGHHAGEESGLVLQTINRRSFTIMEKAPPVPY